MKFAIISLAVVFNITLVVMYSRSLVGAASPERKAAVVVPVAERSASSPYKPAQAATSRANSARETVAAAETGREGKETLEPVRAGDGKETVDPKDGKELIEPVAEGGSALRPRFGPGSPSAEILPGAQARGILAPANRANLDPPVVSPETR